MSLLSKLLSGKKPSVSDVLDLFQGKEEKPAEAQNVRPAAQPYRPEPAYEAQGEPTPLGRSWGELMPDEPNQFNYPGTYREYFEDIFRNDFADCTFVFEQNPRSSRIQKYAFYRDMRKVLVVELVGQGCDAYEVRRLCAKEGTPYLRFYHDHEGWWNARSYVVARMRKAMGD
ncbi:MAG: hypothetical protein J5865_03820 [Lachnospiraceae bacterium]|nr:hypothetical protein [Lachnospiraceae bacterium]